MTAFTLQRTSADQNGVFGQLLDSTGTQICLTLEHAYQAPDGSWKPKLLDGNYTLTRGHHFLVHGQYDTYSFPPFTGWDGQVHTNVLIHPGNSENDSEGCVLLGVLKGELGGMPALLDSKAAFANFLARCCGEQNIQVIVQF